MELRSCYFCGTVGDALDTHALPRDDEAVRVTLCTDCHAKLDRVLDAVAGGPSDHADADGNGTTEAGDAGVGSGEVTFGDPGPAVAPADDRNDAPDAERETEAERADDGAEPTGDDEKDGGNDDAEGSEVADTTEETDAERPRDGDTDRATNGTAPDGTDDAPGGLRGLDAGDGGRLDTYRKALRLLRNREFPMERAAVVDLLGTAYDLDRSECDRLLDFAIEKGMLVEEDGELRRA